ncbi:TonB-dependent receptor [Novosphingobium sp. ST904]|uniref:TonB-dependent receptor n=1 Tax=Novosphingobium sp. ST904 TaxID=1684385 RepID=UPI0006C89130|nr:TonB-dependent receptor [Novosphingobium sp. ST904]KPH59610.1 TonB-dependent receptor [Novosphingobium sp. ST904]TCM38077.1 iron complex outermembrane receptor protein [Novosphingobium sp. ST904]
MKFQSILSTATSTLAVGVAFLAAPAFAQSTGSQDFDNEIVVSGSTDRGVAGIEIPDSPKAKQVLTQELISRGTPGQTINETINLIPGVNFQNYDGFGSSGGNLMIRGFDDTRISQTFDGLPLNDTGGYALYSNQQLDPELIEQVNVNLGTTDVDSPTAAASGSTVNYRSINPSEDFGARMVGTVGDQNKMRVFGLINTGNLNSSGTRAWFSASKDTYDALYGNFGKIDKTQFNAKIYQPLGSNGDFISLAGHYNYNRNNMTSDWTMTTATPFSAGGIPLNKKQRDAYEVARCTIPAGVAGVTDTASSCGSAWEYRYNPSKTANVRLNSRFTLSDKLTLSVDGSYQYTSANGGGTVIGYEGTTTAGLSGYIGGSPYFGGVDLNGDGDIGGGDDVRGDAVRLSAPSQTETNRIGAVASLRYDIDDNNRVRVAYTYDRGRHQQTGEVGFLKANGEAVHYFNSKGGLTDVDGNILQKRDRLSYAILHQVSGEYSGDYVDNRLHVAVGVRVPFFRRNLTQNCLTTSVSGNVNCFTTNTTDQQGNLDANTSFAGPDNRVFNYNRVLPQAGFTFDVAPNASLYFNYSKGLQVPGTDNLYNSFFFDEGVVKPKPETSDNFDGGVRYRSGMIQASLGGWYTKFSNRLSSAYDPSVDRTTYTNLGTVDRYGIDGTFAVAPSTHFKAYVFGSYLWSNIRDDVATGATSVAETGGKMEGGVPSYSFGGRLEGNYGPLSVGTELKRTGSRYYNSLNTAVVNSAGDQIWTAKIPGYTIVNLDARLDLGFLGMGKDTYLQANVTNLFDKYYIGSFDDAGVVATNTTFAYLGAPRTFSASINFQF